MRTWSTNALKSEVLQGMRRNKVRPLSNGNERPINAFDARNKSSGETDGTSQRSPIGNDLRITVNNNDKNQTDAVTQPDVKDVTTGNLVQLPSKSELGNSPSEEKVDILPASKGPVTGLDLSHLDHPVTVDSVEDQTTNSDPERPVRPADGHNMVEQIEADSTMSSEQGLLDYFMELNNNEESSEIDMDTATRILLGGADVNARGTDGQTCVHLAAQYWQIEVVEFLKEKGANLHEPDDYGVTPLHEAARVDNEEVVAYLIENNPNVSQITFDTLQTALHYAVLGNAVDSIYVCN